MKNLFIAIGIVFNFVSYAQIPEVTPELQKKIKQDIEKEIPKLKQRLKNENESDGVIEFKIDTFRIEQFMSKWIDTDYSDFGMKQACYETANLYDGLLNKYYKKLLGILKGDDKKVLIQAQKAWLIFRDNENKLVQTISAEQYSGGGTMQQLTEASMYLERIKDRTLDLVNHYLRITQGE